MATSKDIDSKAILVRAWEDYLKNRIWLVVAAGLLMSVNGLTLALLVKSIQPMIDEVFIAKDADAVIPIATLLFIIFSIRAIATFGSRTITANIGLSVVSDMQRQLSRHLMSLDSRFFNLNSPGSLLERVRGDTQTIQVSASSAMTIAGRDIFALIALTTVLISVDWLWTLFAFIGIPLLALPVNRIHKLVRKDTSRSRDAAANLSNRLDEIFHGIKAIKANRMEEHEAERTDSGVHEFKHRAFQAERAKAAMPSVVDLISGLGFVLVVIYGGHEIINGEKTLGDFMTFFAGLATLFDPIRRLASVGGQLQATAVSLDRIYELLDARPTIVDLPTSTEIKNPNGDIKFSGVTFGYSEDQMVLNDLQLVAESGKMTAIVGASGAGKSTLFNLICRFEEPSKGQLSIGQQELPQIKINSLRDQIALVTQETALFDESIYQNIACGRKDVTEQQVMQAAETALVTEFVAEMPEGIHSLAGPRGSNLSGGQRQRVVIARALLRNTPILLLDEATSALDSRTEKRIQAAMDTILEGKTSLVIAHRLSTVHKAHCIYVMDQGRVLESGTHKELMAAGGVYSAMAASLKDD